MYLVAVRTAKGRRRKQEEDSHGKWKNAEGENEENRAQGRNGRADGEEC